MLVSNYKLIHRSVIEPFCSRMTVSLFLIITLATLAVPVHAQQPPHVAVKSAAVPPTAAMASTGSPIQIQAEPTSFPARQRTNVTVIARIPAVATAVILVLERLNTDGTAVQLGQMHRDAARGDGTYTLVVTFNEASAGEIGLRVAAQPAGSETTGVIMRRANVYSPVAKLTVTDAKSSGTSSWGDVLGSIISGLGSQKNQPTPNPNSDPKDVAVRAKGLSLRYPADWTFDARTLELGGPIALRNFGSYERGGVVPAGGAEINITRIPLGTRSPEDVLHTDLGTVKMGRDRVAEHDAIRASYRDEFSPQLTYDNVAVYVANGDLLYKFFLSFRADDPRGQQFVSSFERILRSVQFTQ